MHLSKSKKKSTNRQSTNKLPAHWDSTVNNLGEMKASPAEIARRRASHTSKNQLAAKVELQRRAMNSVVKSAKKPLPAAFVREVLPKPESVCSEVSDLSATALTTCADRLLQKSARLTAPSACSMVSSSSELHEVNPAITKITSLDSSDIDSDETMHGNFSSSGSNLLPVQVTPLMKSKLDRLSEAVTNPVALNEKPSGQLMREIAKQHVMKKAVDSQSPTISTESDDKTYHKEAWSVKSKHRRLPETAAALEQLFSALKVDAIEAGLLGKPGGSDEGSEHSTDDSVGRHSTLSGHTALLVRVLLGLVGRVNHLEKQLAATNEKLEIVATSNPVSAVEEKLAQCETKVDRFQEELGKTSKLTTESLQRIRSELEKVCISGIGNEKAISPIDGEIVQVEKENDLNKSVETVEAKKELPNHLPPVMDKELDDVEDEDFDFCGLKQSCEKAESPVAKENSDLENAGALSPVPSSIHFCPSISGGTTRADISIQSKANSSIFGDRLGFQLAELTRQHEQARARLKAMQKSVTTMGNPI